MPPWQAEDWRERGAELTVWVDVSPKQRHGRWERRELWALSDPEVNRYAGSAGSVGKAWPHLQQVCRLERRRVRGGIRVAVSYAVTSLSPEVAGAERLLQILRGHWKIENQVHWVRDVTFDEDRSQVRSGNAPQVMAAFRNLTTTLVRWAGHTNVAAALRRHAAHVSEAFILLGITPKFGE
ncbi:MAG: ISAs1 family transposase [Chloroflexota bacterium]|nr:ISAs1 family transposase [Chloroflexota bacterium]